MNIFADLEIDGKVISRLRRPVQGQVNDLDGYFDATMMCKAAGKEWSGYMRKKDTPAFFDDLCTILNRVEYVGKPLQFCRDRLVYSKTDGPLHERGTW